MPDPTMARVITAVLHRCSVKSIIASLILAFSAFGPQARAQVTAFYYTSSPQSFVGQAQTQLVTPDDGYSFQVTASTSS